MEFVRLIKVLSRELYSVFLKTSIIYELICDELREVRTSLKLIQEIITNAKPLRSSFRISLLAEQHSYPESSHLVASHEDKEARKKLA
jgi:hypothetical protein